MATQLNEVWFIPSNGKPVRVGLTKDGAADLSSLPDEVRNHLRDFGVSDELHQGNVLPTEGAYFLQRLIALRDPYMIFRASV